MLLFSTHVEILAVLSNKPQGSTEWRYPKKKVMLVQGMAARYYCVVFDLLYFTARAGGHTNQLSEEFMGGTSAAIDTIPGTKTLWVLISITRVRK